MIHLKNIKIKFPVLPRADNQNKEILQIEDMEILDKDKEEFLI
jgi:hypothetical protein